MNRVADMQAPFAKALLDSREIPTNVRPAADATQRFSVHRNNMLVALIDALATAFPVTRALVGADFFAAMARGYVRVDPPRSPVMAEYGVRFADFIASHSPASGIAYLADVARLERLGTEAFHAANADALDHTRWLGLLADPVRLATLRVHLQPACRWLCSVHPVLSIWQAHQRPDAQRDAALASLDLAAGEDVVVHRPLWEVQQVALPVGGVTWLDALGAGATLGDALQRTCTRHPDASPELLFALLLQQGLVTSITSQKDDGHG